ncbi:unnamed protein product [Closterium sp. Naga37s-1]|nr:unnamed protein product [Closterium sp. Naga37s-1]
MRRRESSAPLLLAVPLTSRTHLHRHTARQGTISPSQTLPLPPLLTRTHSLFTYLLPLLYSLPFPLPLPLRLPTLPSLTPSPFPYLLPLSPPLPLPLPLPVSPSPSLFSSSFPVPLPLA